jgi:hypothetical protein
MALSHRATKIMRNGLGFYGTMKETFAFTYASCIKAVREER